VTLREFARLALCPLVDGEGKDGQNSAPTLAQRGAQLLGPADESHARHMARLVMRWPLSVRWGAGNRFLRS